MRPLRSTPEHERLIFKLESISGISDEEKAAVLDLPLTIRTYGSDADMVREGDRPQECCLVLEGMACGYRLTPAGKRQIINFFVAGDMPDLQSLHLSRMDHGIAAMTPLTAAFIPHGPLMSLVRTYAGLATAFWRDTLIQGAVAREWLVSVGRRSAYTRIAHLLCELQVRLRAVGLAREDGYELPLSQAEIGDALGLSTVHVNRALQALRADGLIVSKGRHLVIPDWATLTQAGEFDRAYLHVRNEAA